MKQTNDYKLNGLMQLNFKPFTGGAPLKNTSAFQFTIGSLLLQNYYCNVSLNFSFSAFQFFHFSVFPIFSLSYIQFLLYSVSPVCSVSPIFSFSYIQCLSFSVSPLSVLEWTKDKSQRKKKGQRTKDIGHRT